MQSLTPHAEFNEGDLWSKLRRCAKASGSHLVRMVLQAYYVLSSSETPLWAKSVLAGALLYFISPVDAIPDVIPVAGFSDDLTVLTTALGTVSAFVTDRVKAQAETTLRRWFD